MIEMNGFGGFVLGRRVAIIAIVFSFWSQALAVPKLGQPVTDHADVLTKEQEQWFAESAAMHKRRSGLTIELLTVERIYPHSIEDYATMVAKRSESAKEARYALLLFATEDGQETLYKSPVLRREISEGRSKRWFDEIHDDLVADKYATGIADIYYRLMHHHGDMDSGASVRDVRSDIAPKQNISKSGQDNGFLYNLNKDWVKQLAYSFGVFWLSWLLLQTLVWALKREPYLNRKLIIWSKWPQYIVTFFALATVPLSMNIASFNYYNEFFTAPDTAWTWLIPVFGILILEKWRRRRLHAWRKKNRRCTKCKSMMALVPMNEHTAPALPPPPKHLIGGMMAYDLWMCRSCHRKRVDAYVVPMGSPMSIAVLEPIAKTNDASEEEDSEF